MTDAEPAPALEMKGLIKRFNRVLALDGASFEARVGEVHGLVGQNGAGKSTLIKILSGLHRPDAGEIRIGGALVEHLTPRRAEEHGIHFIHQDRLLVPTFTVGEALFLGDEPRLARTPLLNRRAAEARAAEILQREFGVRLRRGALIGELSAAQQQIVQITRALLNEPRMLVFDEPTAALVKSEVERLFRTIQRLKARSITIIYISHYLDEIERLCDRVTILRNGANVGTVDPRQVSAQRIASLMVAREIAELFPKRQTAIGSPALKVTNLRRDRKFEDISFEVRRGEIVGLTGLVGSGAKELVNALFGLQRIDGGEAIVVGEPANAKTPAEAAARKLALIPEDRRGRGVALAMSVKENVTLASLARFSRFGFLRRAAERRSVDELIAALSIKTPGREAPLRNLSGGNQQKVSIVKWLSRQSSIYILDEPTVGVDIGSKVEIYALIGKLAEGGSGVLILSSDLLELLGISHRILVMYRGRIVAEADPKTTTSEELLGIVVSGTTERPAHVA
jgi:ribose transport system ATP-binding protein